ncbi:hypothetical protein Slin15195_G073240 [Septoria linicola]|uniref:Uncharacterized protein n=1 Tax=Septoria linicola TaxID=215465 RepID=A0A9Q9ARX8_9PEZI|nr:hypothetical protein Slin15195_G073240 [Septoria linicola]
MAAAIHSTLLGNVEEHELEQCGMIKPGPSGAAKRTVSGAMLSPPSSDSCSTSSTASTITASFWEDTTDLENCSFDMIIDPVSVDALEGIGFNTDTSVIIWQRYQDRDPQSPDSLLDFVLGHIEEQSRFESSNDTEAMTRMGLSEELQERLLSPQFVAIFKTESLSFWVRDTLECRYGAILHIISRAKNMAARSVRVRSKPTERTSLSNTEWQPPTDTPAAVQPLAAPSTVAPALPMTKTSVSNTLEDFNLPEARVAIVPSEPATKPGHVKLYKAIAGSRCITWLSAEGVVKPDRVVTGRGGDFNGTHEAWYWTRELTTAEKYRSWAHHRLPESDVWIISVQVSEHWLAQQQSANLNFSKPWRWYVSKCKQREKPREEEKKFAKVDILSGHICTGMTYNVTSIPEAEVDTTLDRSFVLQHEGVNCTQHCVMNEDKMQEMFEIAKGAVHVDVNPPMHPRNLKKVTK